MKKIFVSFVVAAALVVAAPQTASASLIGDVINWFSGSTATPSGVTLTLDPSSPLRRIVLISSTTPTNSVVLAKYDITSPQNAVFNGFQVYLNFAPYGAVQDFFSNVRLSINGQTFSSSTIVNNLVRFAPLNFGLLANQTAVVTVLGDVKADTQGTFDGLSASTTVYLSSTNPVVSDPSSGNTLPLSSTGSVSSSDVTFSYAAISGMSVKTTPIDNPVTGKTIYSAAYKFTLTAGDNPLYISKALYAPTGQVQFVATTSSYYQYPMGDMKLSTVDVNPTTAIGDDTKEYVILPGTSRDFTLSGSINPSQSGTFKILWIKYGIQSRVYNHYINVGNSLTSQFLISDGINPTTITFIAPTSTVQTNFQYKILWTDHRQGGASPHYVVSLTTENGKEIIGETGISACFSVCSIGWQPQKVSAQAQITIYDSVNDPSGAYAARSPFFSIRGGTPITATSSEKVTLLIPQGGTSLLYQKSNLIKWSGGKNKVLIGVIDYEAGINSDPVGWITLNGTPNGSTGWNAYTVTDLSGSSVAELAKIAAGPYKIIAISANANGNYCVKSTTEECNVSISQPFTIAKETTQIINTVGGTTSPTTGTTTLGGCVDGFVKDASGNCVPTSASYVLKVLAPNTRENLIVGQTYRVKWSGGRPGVEVWLLDDVTRLGKKIYTTSNNLGYFDWRVYPLLKSDLYDTKTNQYMNPSGHYVIFVNCAPGSCTVDDSDTYFTISTSSISPSPYANPDQTQTVQTQTQTQTQTTQTTDVMKTTNTYTSTPTYLPTPSFSPSYSPSYSPVYSPTYTPSPAYSPSYSPTYSPTYSPSPTYSASPSTVRTTTSPSYSSSPSKSGTVSYGDHNFVASVFYAIGDVLDSVF